MCVTDSRTYSKLSCLITSIRFGRDRCWVPRKSLYRINAIEIYPVRESVMDSWESRCHTTRIHLCNYPPYRYISTTLALNNNSNNNKNTGWMRLFLHGRTASTTLQNRLNYATTSNYANGSTVPSLRDANRTMMTLLLLLPHDQMPLMGQVSLPAAEGKKATSAKRLNIVVYQVLEIPSSS